MHTPRNVQPPYTADDFWNRWNSVNPRMALFIKITPSNIFGRPTDDPIGLTSNTRDMTLPGHSVTFRSAAGMIPSEMTQSFGEVATMEFQGFYSDNLFTAEDVINGKLTDASVEIFASPWDDVNLGELVFFTGNLAELEHHDTYFKGEVRGLSARLSQETGPVTSRSCRVAFRSAACGHTASTVTIGGNTFNIQYSGTLGGNVIQSTRSFLTVSLNPWPDPIIPQNFFQNGKVTINGVTRQIAESFSADEDDVPEPEVPLTLKLKRPFPFTPELGDAVTIIAGCNKRVEDCQKFNNIVNFRGEPYVPGLEVINRVPPPRRL